MTTQRTYPVKKGETVQLTIETVAFGGKGIARVDGYAIFVARGLPGQTVEATIIRRKRDFAEARIERVIEPAPDQQDPKCDHFRRCGGCSHQHWKYAAQLKAKRTQVEDCLRRIGNLEIEVAEPLAADVIYDYRNKMEYSFSSTRWIEDDEGDITDRFGLGLHVPGRFDRVVNIDRCHIAGAESSAILQRTRELTHATKLPAYSTRTHEGFWRFLLVRRGVNTGELMVVLITNRTYDNNDLVETVDGVAETLLEEFPEITSLLHGESGRKASIAVCDELTLLAGKSTLHESLLDIDFTITPSTFFQTNTRQAEKMFRYALDLLDPKPSDTAWDLYCGTGAISLPLAKRVQHLTGVELVDASVAAAAEAAGMNQVLNAGFVAADVKHWILEQTEKGNRPDIIVVDPPRAGLHPDIIQPIANSGARKLLYISCNPGTFARDLSLFAEQGLTTNLVQPVDMFPQTSHIECVAVLEPAGN
ncbi:MAG: 23S rRNA (uracil(1939)-C(5))-methyltransferase RlmD [Candidatus Eisenbacteria bacterium]|uniref:23S rRNA (Uracil(1939)-C(5))-methyltransferase RlmD n=1 Tax=Eiseniibacteriota bacterium TaxID=2212470 RepID=A0A7Y2H4A1_UNCEI|nr:23S rRNA (uracil(1939)-C(5))-methyltransferase RlmD [Candidatus Eisenbacteria bacterium]